MMFDLGWVHTAALPTRTRDCSCGESRRMSLLKVVEFVGNGARISTSVGSLC